MTTRLLGPDFVTPATEGDYTYPVGRRKLIDPPRPFVVRIPVPLQDRVRARAKRDGTKINDVVETALVGYLRTRRKTQPIVRGMVPRKTRGRA